MAPRKNKKQKVTIVDLSKTSAPKRYSKKKSNIAKVVKSIMNESEETKFVVNALYSAAGVGQNLSTHVPFSSAINSSSECYNCIPQVNQGTDDHNRIGNVIQPRSLVVKGTISLRGTNLNSESVYADIYFLTSKNVKDQANQNTLPITEMLNYGDGTNGNYSGFSYIAQLPINKTQFNVIKHLRVLLQKGAGDPNTALSGGATSSTDTYSYNRNFTVKIPVPAKFTYEDKNAIWPTNFYPFMCAGFYGTDQQGDSAPVNPRVYIQAQAQLYYKDC